MCKGGCRLPSEGVGTQMPPMHRGEVGLQFGRDAEDEGGEERDARGRDHLRQCASTPGGIVR